MTDDAGRFWPRNCTDCSAALSERAKFCPACGNAAPPRQLMLELAFAWGVEAVDPGTPLRIGRDPEWSPLAARFDGFEAVSRRHAEIAIVAGTDEVSVRDLGSTNGTALDGVWMTTGASSVAAQGTVVLFGPNGPSATVVMAQPAVT